MAIDQDRRHCKICREYTLHARHRMGGFAHFIITILTGGLWLPFWCLSGLVGSYHCQRCGSRAHGSGCVAVVVVALLLIVGLGAATHLMYFHAESVRPRTRK
jgi:hypothetical protein